MSEESMGMTDQKASGVNKPLFLISGGFIAVFCLAALINLDALSAAVDWGFNVSAKYFGLYWQVLLLATFLIGLVLCVLPGGRAVMGGLAAPEFTMFQWGSMIMCTLLAGGGVFWAAGEPIAHFLSSPPLYGAEGGTAEAVNGAIAQSFMHWGFLAWAILGSLSTVMLMYYHYEKGLPLAPRTLLYPVFGDKAIHGPIGLIADASSIIAVVAGTVGPIGFLGLQVAYGLEDLFGIANGFATQFLVIAGLVALYTISAMTGLSRGIQLLSKINVILAAALLLFVLLAGPTGFIFGSFFSGFGTYIANFFQMALYRGDAGLFGAPGWLGWWTVFFWGWFMGYGPLMAMFIARVSRGRSIRSIIIMLSIVAPIVTNFWFTIIGGTGISMELAETGTISKAFEGFNLPPTLVRVFWGIAMGVMAVILISVGSGGVSKLQSFIVVTAVPVSLLLLPSLWDALRITLAKGKEN